MNRKLFYTTLGIFAFFPFGGMTLTAGLTGHFRQAIAWLACMALQLFALSLIWINKVRKRPHRVLDNVVTGAPEIYIDKPFQQRIAGSARDRRKARRASGLRPFANTTRPPEDRETRMFPQTPTA